MISATFSTRGLVFLLQICLKINDGKNCEFETKARHVGPLTLQRCEAAEPIHFTFEKGLLNRLTVPILFIYIGKREVKLSFWWHNPPNNLHIPLRLFSIMWRKKRRVGVPSHRRRFLTISPSVVSSADFDFVAFASGPNRKIPDCDAVSAPQILRTYNAYKMSIQSTPMSHFSANLAELTLTLGRRVKCHSNQCR